jgi:serine phosphatase RsbU (regulator of sigma subunit)
LDRDTLHVSLTDAMGHAEDAALLASLLVGSLRNSRRSGATLAEQAAWANAAILEHGRADQFVTGQLLRIDLTTGTGAMINAGHPGPLRVRDGRVEDIELAADPPFGIVPGIDYRVQRVALLPGDPPRDRHRRHTRTQRRYRRRLRLAGGDRRPTPA